ncbi:MAG TPA: TonB-dependent receptor [Pyrinomonadaceae bacterium]|nr:TonB-dependent receptor [Pyrinomonadaceae bacterium]
MRDSKVIRLLVICALSTWCLLDGRYHDSKVIRLLVICALSLSPYLALTSFTSAQDTVTGAFEGTVTNSQTGEPIPNATADIINQQTNLVITKRTDSRGRFYQGLLNPGFYTIRVSAPGYQTKEVVQRLFITRTGEVVPVPVQLDPATAASTATPTPTPSAGSTGPPPARNTDVRAEINTLDGRRSGAFTEDEAATLPLGGATQTRTFDELALLLAGVASPPQTIGNGAGPGIGAGVGSAGQFAVNGLRSRGNNFTVDGSDNNDEDIGVRRQGFLALVPQSIESIKEYQAITLLAPAQFGRNIGAQVNAVSKSGGNETHGSAYGMFNSSQLNARNFFDTKNGDAVTPLTSGNQSVIVASQFINDFSGPDATFKFLPVNGRPLTVNNRSGKEDSFTLGQGGVVLGGPVIRDKAFYFFSAEGYLLNATKEASFAVPTVTQRGAFGTGASGIFMNPFTGEPEFSIPTTTEGDAIFSLFPFPNNPNGVYGANTFTQLLPANGRGKIFSAKYDHNFGLGGRQQSVTGRYNFTDDWRDIPVAGGALFSTLRPRVRTQNFSFFFNSELSGPDAATLMFNQVRLSYGRTRLRFDDVHDREFLVPSNNFPNEPFLLNAPLLTNVTVPTIDRVNDRIVANTGDVLFRTGGTTEELLGPVGQVLIAGFSPVGVDVFNFPQKRVNNTYQFADQLTVRRNGHSFTFGTDNRRTELNSDLPRNFRPLITFNGAPEVGLDADNNFLFTNTFQQPIDLAAAAAASGFFQTLTAGSDASINLRFYQINFYGQHDWRVRRDLSLSYGLRYEYNTPAKEVNQQVESSFNDPALNLVPGLSRFIDGRTRSYEPDKNNFAPRVGLAYSPNLFGPERATVFRLGYGLFYDQILGAVVSQSRNVFPRFVTVNLAGGLGNVFFDPEIFLVPLGLLNPAANPEFVLPGTLNRLNPASTLADQITLINCIASAGGGNCPIENSEFFLPSASGVEVTLPARRLQMPNAQHYAFTFEQQVSPDLAFSVGYVGTSGRNLLRFTTPNLGSNAILLPVHFEVPLDLSFQPRFFGVAVQPGTRITSDGDFIGGRPVPSVGGVNIFETSANSRYDALQLELRGRLRRHMSYYASYAFSKATDDVSDVFDLAGASALPQNSLTLAGERGPANFDVRHRFTYYFVYDVPANSFQSDFWRFLFTGVRLTSTGRFQSGQPFTVNSIFDVNLDGNLTDRLNTTEGVQVTGERRQPLRLTTTDLTALLAPVGEDGSVGRNTLRAVNILELDLAISKTFSFSDRYRIDARMEVFNFINRANFGIPVRFLEAPGFGNATDTVTPGRRIQFSLKFNF